MSVSTFSMSESTSPMPRMREAMRSGWKTSRSTYFSPTPTSLIGRFTTDLIESAAPPRAIEVDVLFADADELDWTIHDRLDRERRAAARVAVELRQHDAGDADPRVELARALDRVLPRHRVGDEQPIRRMRRALDRDELV